MVKMKQSASQISLFFDNITHYCVVIFCEIRANFELRDKLWAMPSEKVSRANMRTAKTVISLRIRCRLIESFETVKYIRQQRF